MLTKLIVLATALPAMIAAAVVPTSQMANAIEVDGLEKRQDNKCSAYKFMSLGQLNYKNEAAVSARLSWRIPGRTGWTDLTSPIIYAGESYTFSANNQLAIIPRDTTFELRVCDQTPIIGSGCLDIPGVFQVPNASQPAWSASITTKIVDVIKWTNTCGVGSQVQ